MMACEDFVQADSRNLPDMELVDILEYFATSNKANIAEIRSVKTLMSPGNDYQVQDDVGYVELSRGNNVCIARAKILPKHNITKKYHVATVTIHEPDRTITDAGCDSCPESEGICRHTLKFLVWLVKKSTLPEPESVQSYWMKPLGKRALKPLLAKDIGPYNRECTRGPRDPAVLKGFYAECKKRNMNKNDSMILMYMPDSD